MSSSAIIFDCDGVLVESEDIAARVNARYFESFGLSLTTDRAKQRFLGKTINVLLDEVSNHIGVPISSALTYEWAMALAYELAKQLKPVPGVTELLSDLFCHGRNICVASQSPLPRVQLSLHMTSLAKYFGSNIFTAAMVPNPKPAPDLFLFAAKALGVIPDECCVVEDSLVGVLAATAAGMRVFGYVTDQNGGDLELAGATVFHSMDELATLIV